MQWWFCLIHKVAEAGSGCANDLRLGPYDSQDQAIGALGRISERNDALDQEDDD
jgi:hypothetical protein